jgi:hypothetical protein
VAWIEERRAWWLARWSLASSYHGAQELTGEGAKERGEHGEPISGLTRARAVVWWLGDDEEAVAEGKLDGGGA